MIQNEDRFNQLVNAALAQDFSGWDFSFLEGRKLSTEYLPWDYTQEVRQQMKHASTMLDMGTGGGEFLSSLAPFPETTYATEGWALNVPIAQKRLEPLGVKVYSIEDKYRLPFDDNTFDLVINRHEGFHVDDIHRMLKPDGFFITQQVGGLNNIRFNELLNAPLPKYYEVSLKGYVRQLEKVGFEILRAEEHFPEERYLDIGAVVYNLKVISWQIEDFSVEKYRPQLGKIHNMIERDGYVAITAHRFFIKAQKKNIPG
jgi:SAM-dependent methyltransferase